MRILFFFAFQRAFFLPLLRPFVSSPAFPAPPSFLSVMSVGPVLTVSYIANQFGAPAELRAIAAKNANFQRVENNITLV